MVVEDDPDDRLLLLEAMQVARIPNPVFFLEDGEQALDYLQRRGRYSNPMFFPLPGLILLDLNLPRCDGREVLGEIKSDPALRGIPVVVFTTSHDRADIFESYRRGANSYVVKPATFRELVDVAREVCRYWSTISNLRPELHAEK
jgi:CheY-like chemotaxis protein